MDVREKLVELLKNTEINKLNGHTVLAETCFTPRVFENMATNLIAHGVTVQEQDGCEYCNGLPFSQMEDFTMPNAAKKDYDIVTIRYCPMCGRRLPQPPKGE